MFYRHLASLVALFWVCAGVGASGQYFGKNKVHYETYDFRILQTDHFDLYYYPAARDAVEIAARLAERWYARLSRVLGHELSDRQPVILYGSHPDFAKTNVVSRALGEEIGGVTESRRRRIVLPFTNGLREFDHVLGHELAHAFQFDIAERLGRTSRLPLWFAEGMAEYLSVGSVDPFAPMWNWGVVAEQVPFARGRRRRYETDGSSGRVTVETDRLFQMHRELTGILAYPFNRAERLELRGGVSAITFGRDIQSRTYSLATRRLVEEEQRAEEGGDPVRLGLAAVALVHDTAVFGAAGPILGQRYRFEVAPAVGDLLFVRVLADYRRYVMPLRPFTIAGRLLHIGRYGPGADDPRLEPYFVGYPGLVRGYRSGALRRMVCHATGVEECDPFESFTGSKMMIANLEPRFFAAALP